MKLQAQDTRPRAGAPSPHCPGLGSNRTPEVVVLYRDKKDTDRWPGAELTTRVAQARKTGIPGTPPGASRADSRRGLFPAFPDPDKPTAKVERVQGLAAARPVGHFPLTSEAIVR